MSDGMVETAAEAPVNDGVIGLGDLGGSTPQDDTNNLGWAERKGRIKEKYEQAVIEAESETMEDENTVVFVDDAAEGAESPSEAVTSADTHVEQDIPGEAPVAPPTPKAEVVEETPSAEEAPAPGKFKVRDAKGEFITPPDVKVDFTVGEKSYRKDIPSLVRMALDGVNGQKVAAQARQLETEVIPRLRSEYEQTLNEKQADFEAQSSLVRRILSDPTGQEWLKQHEAWNELHSPEAQAQRAEQRAAEAERRLHQNSRADIIRQVSETHIKPLVAQIERECPDVDGDAMLGLMMKYSAPLQGPDGIIPQHRYHELVAQLHGPVLQEARQKQERFNALRTAQAAQIDAEKKAQAGVHAKALKDAQRKQNASVAPLAPSKVQSPSTHSDSVTSAKPIKSMADWKNHVNKSYRQYA